MLASDFGRHSLDRLQDENVSTSQSSSTLSPASLLGDSVDTPAPSGQSDASSMDVDIAQSVSSYFGAQTKWDGPGSETINIAPSNSSSAMSNNTISAGVPRTFYGPDFGLSAYSLDVDDEGFCEQEEDIDWRESIGSVRLAGVVDGMRKRHGLKYRRSAEVAKGCNNVVHMVPRMRRRDKIRRHAQTAEGPASNLGVVAATH